jgi:hypothetical protein
MLFVGQELRELIARTANEIEVHNTYGRCCQVLSSAKALKLDLDQYVGVGNRRRIRFPAQSHTNLYSQRGKPDHAAPEE